MAQNKGKQSIKPSISKIMLGGNFIQFRFNDRLIQMNRGGFEAWLTEAKSIKGDSGYWDVLVDSKTEDATIIADLTQYLGF